MGGRQNYDPFLDRYRDIFRDPKKDHNFENHPHDTDLKLFKKLEVPLEDAWFAATELALGGIGAR